MQIIVKKFFVVKITQERKKKHICKKETNTSKMITIKWKGL